MIYLIVNQSNTYCKIGYSKHPDKRLLELQTSNPEKLTLLRSYEGFKALEKHIHFRYKHLNVKNEWFKYSTELLKDLDKNFKDINIEHEQIYSIFGYEVSKEEFESFKPGVKVIDLPIRVQQVLELQNNLDFKNKDNE
jgi:hypothetical protein